MLGFHDCFLAGVLFRGSYPEHIPAMLQLFKGVTWENSTMYLFNHRIECGNRETRISKRTWQLQFISTVHKPNKAGVLDTEQRHRGKPDTKWAASTQDKSLLLRRGQKTVVLIAGWFILNGGLTSIPLPYLLVIANILTMSQIAKTYYCIIIMHLLFDSSKILPVLLVGNWYLIADDR